MPALHRSPLPKIDYGNDEDTKLDASIPPPSGVRSLAPPRPTPRPLPQVAQPTRPPPLPSRSRSRIVAATTETIDLTTIEELPSVDELIPPPLPRWTRAHRLVRTMGFFVLIALGAVRSAWTRAAQRAAM